MALADYLANKCSDKIIDSVSQKKYTKDYSRIDVLNESKREKIDGLVDDYWKSIEIEKESEMCPFCGCLNVPRAIQCDGCKRNLYIR